MFEFHRHARACPGHPRLPCVGDQDVDGRDKPGHDENGECGMHIITLDSETDFDGWRKAARALALNDVKPSDVTWNVAGDAPELFESTTPLPDPPNATFNVPAKFVELAKAAILHRSVGRFALPAGAAAASSRPARHRDRSRCG